MTEPVRVCLELEPDGNSLTGRARDASGATKQFSGWLGLAAAIDAFLLTAGQPPDHPSGPCPCPAGSGETRTVDARPADRDPDSDLEESDAPNSI